MPETPESTQNAEQIKDVEATQHGARGNVHSEEEGSAADQDAPPPLPN